MFARFFGKPKQPDMKFAAEAFFAVALVRKAEPQVDLHWLEQATAERLLAEGSTKEETLSARWGGAYAINCDMEPYYDLVGAFIETCQDTGREFDRDEPHIFGARTLLGMALEAHPNEYERFLKHINQ